MQMNELQERLWRRMVALIDDFKLGKIEFRSLVAGLEGTLYAGEFRDKELVEKWYDLWAPLEIEGACSKDVVVYEQVAAELEAVRRFLAGNLPTTPDFFLTCAGESETLLVEPRACWVKGRLKDHLRDDHLVVEIKPPLFRQEYGGVKDITDLLLTGRYSSLHPIEEWPCHVYVSRLLDDSVLKTGNITGAEKVEIIAWGVILQTLEEAEAFPKG